MASRAAALLPILGLLSGCCLESVNGLALSDGGLSSTVGGGATSGNSTGGVGTAGGTACLAVVPPPPDAGPMLAFDPNPAPYPLGPDEGLAVNVTSLAGERLRNYLFVQELAQDGSQIGRAATYYIGGGPSGPGITGSLNLSPMLTGPISLAADDGGLIVLAQLLTDDAGVQVCTAFGQPCGEYGDCCVGLSCQAGNAGCSCEYAWPAFTQ